MAELPKRKGGSSFQLVSTIVKIAVIAALVIGIFFFGNGSVQNFYEADSPKEGGALISGIIAALTGAFFAYDGWVNITFIAGEIKKPQRNIPKSLFTGVIACIIVYVLVNQAYLCFTGRENCGSSLVASDAISFAIGNTGGALVAAMIVICTLGAINGNIMATTRITYAMGKG